MKRDMSKNFALAPGQARRRMRPESDLPFVIQRERSRADRNGSVLSLVIIDLNFDDSPSLSLEAFLDFLGQRLRISDSYGVFEDGRPAVVLPETDADGAWTVADDIAQHLDRKDGREVCVVYTYPGQGADDYPADRNGNGAVEGRRPSTNGKNGKSERPALLMGELFCQPLPTWKRALDVAVSVTALVVLLPVLAAVAALIKLTSKGPVIFRQTRSGLGGRTFELYKFRSMVENAEALRDELTDQNEVSGPVFKMERDPRITTVGRWLRKSSLDELPQLWNVLRGDMSLVGPRPPIPAETLEYDGWQRRRLEVTPGITCIWQVSGRSNVPFIEWMRMDIRYARRITPWGDFLILLKTAPAILSGDGAN